MLRSVWAVVHDGKIQLIEEADLPEGARVLVTILPPEDESRFWLEASQTGLAEVWDNAEDDVYAQLLEK
jgi:hypothetical protein